jgi:vitamin B12 transporter
MPGSFVVRPGQYGSPTLLFLRGSNPDANHVDMDGVPIDDIGGGFDYSTLSTAGIGQLEVYRGPNSVLYGSDASAGVVSLTTQRGSTGFPSLFYEGDAGTFTSFRNLAQIGGTHRKIDYYGGFDGFQSDNSLKMDEFHDYTSIANLGYALTSSTQARVIARNSDVATGMPGAFNFYGIPNAGKRSNQDIYLGASLENRTLTSWHNLVRYDMTRKREETTNFYPNGIPLTIGNYYGYNIMTRGANDYSVTGQAILNFAGTYPNTVEQVTDRDRVYFQSDMPLPFHVLGMFTFRYEDERGAKKSVALGLDQTLDRRNYDYTLQFSGNYKHRVYYTLGGGAEKNELFGTVGTPRLGVAYYPVRPGQGIAHGTRFRFSFANGYQEPSLSEQFSSLYTFLETAQGGPEAISQFHITPIVEEQVRTYEGGVTQSFFNQRGLLNITYFHNQYGRQLEPVPATEVPLLLPQLSPAQQQDLKSLISSAGDLDVNSQAFGAQGVESELTFSVMRSLFLRAGYTYLDAVVQRSFTSDALHPVFNTGLPGQPAPSFSNIPIGAFQPLRGARPFNRPPNTGFATAAYASKSFSGAFTASIVTRSDDSTFLGGRDTAEGNSLLLPNRNLDFGYSKLDLSASYQLLSWVAAYAQLDNLTGNKKIAPIGYPSLPFTYRVGLRFAFGHQKN